MSCQTVDHISSCCQDSHMHLVSHLPDQYSVSLHHTRVQVRWETRGHDTCYTWRVHLTCHHTLTHHCTTCCTPDTDCCHISWSEQDRSTIWCCSHVSDTPADWWQVQWDNPARPLPPYSPSVCHRLCHQANTDPGYIWTLHKYQVCFHKQPEDKNNNLEMEDGVKQRTIFFKTDCQPDLTFKTFHQFKRGFAPLSL